MNCVFKNNKDNKEFSEFFMPEYKLEGSEIEDNILESHSNVPVQLNYFKLSSYGLQSIDDEYMFDSKFITSKNVEDDDMIFSSNLKSTWLLNDSSRSIIDAKNSNSIKELDNCSIHCIDENVSLEDRGLQHLENEEELRYSIKTIFVESNNSKISLDQDEHHMTDKAVNHQNIENSDKKRWGRKQDIQAFKALKELSIQEGILFDSFFDEESSLTEKHYYILFKLVCRYNWKRNTQKMLNRIRSLRKNQKMSVREQRQFERLRKQAKKKNEPFNIEEITHLFPGKLVSTLKSCINPEIKS